MSDFKFVDFIQKYIDENDISTYKLCKETKINIQTFLNWKNGTEPSLEKAIRIAKYLNLSIDEIFELRETTEDKELLRLFHKLPREEQLKEIGRLESKVEELDELERSKGETLSESKIG